MAQAKNVVTMGSLAYSCRMRCCLLYSFIVWLAFAGATMGATGRIVKVLPHFLDLQGRHTLSPSLYERDAYQVRLREHPSERSGIRYDVEWKTKGGSFDQLKLQLELRGLFQGKTPRTLTLEKAIARRGWNTQWTGLPVTGQQYKDFGEVIAWRVTLWEGEKLLDEQQSFLW